MTGDPSVIRDLTARPDLQACFSGSSWRPAFVDLRRVLSLQKHVSTTGQAERVAATPLVDLCLPTIRQPQLRWSQDGDGKGMTLSSPDLNLRVAGCGLSLVEIGPGQRRPAVQIVIDIPPSFVNVGFFRGRYILRDGYHRAGGLLQAGKPIVPCVIMEVKSIQELTLGNPALFSEEVLFDERPPALTDFWDDLVADAGRRPGRERVVRVRGDEIVH